MSQLRVASVQFAAREFGLLRYLADCRNNLCGMVWKGT